MLTDEQILEIAKATRLDMGARPPPKAVPVGDGKFGFRQPPGLTIYGESLIIFARAVIAASALASLTPEG